MAAFSCSAPPNAGHTVCQVLSKRHDVYGDAAPLSARSDHIAAGAISVESRHVRRRCPGGRVNRHATPGSSGNLSMFMSKQSRQARYTPRTSRFESAAGLADGAFSLAPARGSAAPKDRCVPGGARSGGRACSAGDCPADSAGDGPAPRSRPPAARAHFSDAGESDRWVDQTGWGWVVSLGDQGLSLRSVSEHLRAMGVRHLYRFDFSSAGSANSVLVHGAELVGAGGA